MSAQSSGRQPPTGRPFKPGQSGNPGGLPKFVKEFRDALRTRCAPLAERHLFRVLGGVDDLMTEEDVKRYQEATTRDRTQAAEVVLSYSVPKPKQQVAVKHSGKVEAPLAGVDVADLVALAKAQNKEG